MSVMPRYKLEAGAQFRYRLSDEVAGQVHANGARDQAQFSIVWDFCVVARNEDGSWRLLFAESRTQENNSPLGQRAVHTIDNDGVFDLTDDGRLSENWTITPLANPTVVFPQLPRDECELESGWQSTLQLDDAHRRFMRVDSAASANESTWQFVEDCQTRLDPIYLASRRRDYAFDLERGVVTRVTTNFKRGWPAPFASTDSMHLIEVVEPHDAESVPAIDIVDRYLEVCSEFQRFIELALWDAPKTSYWLNKAAAALEQFETHADSTFLRRLARRKLILLEHELDDLLSGADQIGRMIDRPAPDWQTIDLSGESHRADDYRGTMLVLVFWNRGCSWCIRSLMALNRLASEMRDEPVAFLGVGVDNNVEDRAFVSQALQLRFPTIANVDGNTNISSLYGFTGYPTTVLIDAGGFVRRIRDGYSAQLNSLLARDLRCLASGGSIATATG